MARNYLVFGAIEGKLDVLRVECTRCDRKGRYSVAKLIEKYGRKGNMMKWREMLNADCPKRDATGLHNRCDLVCPICRRYCEKDQFELKQTLSVAEGSQPKPTPRDTMPYLFQGGLSMKKLFLASAAALVTLNAGGSALAADMPVKARPVPPPAVYSWTGCYGGGFVGYGWGNSQHRSLDPRERPESGLPIFASESDGRRIVGDITPSFNMSGALGGFNVGCQYQFGWWLIGIEGDGAATNKDGQAFNFFRGKGSIGSVPRGPFVSQTTERWMSTARLRLGWAADKWLFFITGGGAWSGVEVTVWAPPIPTTTAHHKRTLTGWTVGAGWEYALGYGWSWKSEFLYIDYGWTKFFDPADTCSPDCSAFLNPREVNLKNYVFRTGLNWRFDWGKAPVAVMAKY